MTSIFVSYRREDSRHQTGRLHDRLVTYFGLPQVFKDVDSIPLGSDFRRVLSDRVAACDVFLAVIGDGWLTAVGKNGNRRLDDPADYVRIEIETALHRKIPVIPVLVGTSGVPRGPELPESLRELAYRNAIRVRPDPDFHKDVDRLIRGIETVRASSASRPPRADGSEILGPLGSNSSEEMPFTASIVEPARSSNELANGDVSGDSGKSGKFFLSSRGWGIGLNIITTVAVLGLVVFFGYRSLRDPEPRKPVPVVDQGDPSKNPVTPDAAKDQTSQPQTPAPGSIDSPPPTVVPPAPVVAASIPPPSAPTTPISLKPVFVPGEVRRLIGNTGSIKDLSISADGVFAIVCDQDRARYYDVETGKDLIKNRLTTGLGVFIRLVALSPDGKQVLLSGADKEAVLWDFADRRKVIRFPHPVNVISVTLTPDGRYASTVSQDLRLRIWSLNPVKLIKELRVEPTDICFALASGAEIGVNGSKLGFAEIWESKSSTSVKLLRRLEGHTGPIHGVALSEDASRVLTGGEDGTVRLWDAQTGRERNCFRGHQGPVYAVSITADGRTGISGGADGTVRVWKFEP